MIAQSLRVANDCRSNCIRACQKEAYLLKKRSVLCRRHDVLRGAQQHLTEE